MITSRLAVSVSTVLALAAFACSSAPTTDIGTGTPTKSATKTGVLGFDLLDHRYPGRAHGRL